MTYSYDRQIISSTDNWSDSDPRAPKTPWGSAQHGYNIARGVTWYSTASHGGLKVAPGVAKKFLSKAAIRAGDIWGGAYWYEEDVAWNIPFYEVNEWNRKQHQIAGGPLATPEQMRRTIERYFPQYLKNLEKDMKDPQPGDKLVALQDITLSRGTVIPKASQLTYLGNMRLDLLLQGPSGFKFRMSPRSVGNSIEWVS
jgi:hypothetical protein